MYRDEVDILYIAGWGRSGSTILGNILGQCEDCIHVGELWYMWQRGVRENRLCGCGEPFLACPFWNSVLEMVQKKWMPIEPIRMIALQRKFARTRNLPDMLIRRPTQLTDPELQFYVDGLFHLYTSIRDVTGAKLIVDSSKLPAYANILSHIPGLHVSILHLIRDPRGTAYAWRKQKYDPTQERYMVQNTILKNGIIWTTWNLFIELLWRDHPRSTLTRLRYEDFASQPRHTIEQILHHLGIEEGLSFFHGSSHVNLGVHHTVSGNPVRTKTGSTPIKLDREWMDNLAFFDRWLTTVLTAPLLWRYQYPLMGALETKDQSAH